MMNTNKRKRNHNQTTKAKGGNKRKRLSREELHEEDVKIRYSKLVNKAAKVLRKEAKVCKTFECQKIIRNIKTMNKTSIGSNNSDDNRCDKKIDQVKTEENEYQTKIKKKIQNLEEKLEMTKSLELDKVVHVSLTRLGLDPTKVAPKKAQNKKKSKETKKHNEEGNALVVDDDVDDDVDDTRDKNKTQLIESILKHKKMISAIETVNSSAIEYNRWLAKEEEWLHSGGKKSLKKKNKKNENDTNNYRSSADVSAHIADSGLFITSLAGGNDDEDDEEDNAELLEQYAGFGQDKGNNDGDYEMYRDGAPTKKKNRMGQRERKARAMAFEAREQQGKRYDPGSIKKWWELKPKNPKKDKAPTKSKKDQLASGLDASKKVEASEVVTMGTNWKDEGKAHPSWAARQVQKSKSGSGIGNIEFKGKKITFD